MTNRYYEGEKFCTIQSDGSYFLGGLRHIFLCSTKRRKKKNSYIKKWNLDSVKDVLHPRQASLNPAGSHTGGEWSEVPTPGGAGDPKKRDQKKISTRKRTQKNRPLAGPKKAGGYPRGGGGPTPKCDPSLAPPPLFIYTLSMEVKDTIGKGGGEG